VTTATVLTLPTIPDAHWAHQIALLQYTCSPFACSRQMAMSRYLLCWSCGARGRGGPSVRRPSDSDDLRAGCGATEVGTVYLCLAATSSTIDDLSTQTGDEVSRFLSSSATLLPFLLARTDDRVPARRALPRPSRLLEGLRYVSVASGAACRALEGLARRATTRVRA
jgi:hypothetical protein